MLEELEGLPEGLGVAGAAVAMALVSRLLGAFAGSGPPSVLEGETIPHEEKLFSLFEPHTRWIMKGKAGRGRWSWGFP